MLWLFTSFCSQSLSSILWLKYYNWKVCPQAYNLVFLCGILFITRLNCSFFRCYYSKNCVRTSTTVIIPMPQIWTNLLIFPNLGSLVRYICSRHSDSMPIILYRFLYPWLTSVFTFHVINLIAFALSKIELLLECVSKQAGHNSSILLLRELLTFF